MPNNVYKFRRIKWGDPRPKLKVLVEDFKQAPWIDRISSKAFAVLVLVVTVLVFAVTMALTRLLP